MLKRMLATAVLVICREAYCVALPHTANHHWPYLFRHPVLAFLNALLLAIAIGTSLTLSLTPETARLSTISGPTLIQLTNSERTRAGLPPLRENTLLQRSASLKAQHMLQHDYFEHASPDGLSPWAWFDRANYRYLYAGENLAIDFSEAEGVVTAWMRSAGHRRNVLSDRYDEIGIAVLTGEFEGRTATVVVQHFGSLGPVPRSTLRRPGGGPRVAERQTSAPVPALAPPTILEPTAGALLSKSPATVRGRAEAGSAVTVLLDGTSIGTFEAPAGTFVGTFPLPENAERASELTARATRNGRTSALSAPRRVTVDTQAPELAAERAVLLPDPQGLPGRVLLVVPATSDVARATLAAPGQDPVPLSRADGVLYARLRLADLRTAATASVLVRDTAAPTLLVADARGNARTIVPQTLLPYVTASPPGEAPRARVAVAAVRIRPWVAGLLTALSALLAANILVHLRLHRLLHADVLAHALVVIGLGSTLVVLR